MSKSSLSSVYQYSSESGHLQRGLADIQQGVRRRLWWDLAKRDLRERYHGAALGVVWVLITTAMLSAGLAVIYSQVFSVDMAQFLPYVTAGISVWSFVSGLLTDSTQVFTTAASYFKQLPMPTSVFVYRMVARNICFMILRIVVVVVVLILLGREFQWVQLQAVFGLVTIAVWGVGLGFLVGPIAARYRDLSQAIVAGTTFAFFVTPVFWYADKLQEYAFVVWWNPLYHMLESVRQPLLGEASGIHLQIAVVIALVTLAAGTAVYSSTRSKLFYWC